MEHSPNVAVVPAALEWSDVGSLLALKALGTPDAVGNVRIGRGVDIDTHNTIIYSADRLVVTLGLVDMVVVDTKDATLICPKDRCQDVRSVVDALKAIGVDELTEPCNGVRSWGKWTTLLRGAGFQVKLLEINPGGISGLQQHYHRTEHWEEIKGFARVTRNDEVHDVPQNGGIVIPPGAAHRLENPGKIPLNVIEVQVGEYLGEQDTIRIIDHSTMEATTCLNAH
jgi:mannose-1-phosphate guanylyltransferase/mannose-6-phosphate isomerase